MDQETQTQKKRARARGLRKMEKARGSHIMGNLSSSQKRSLPQTALTQKMRRNRLKLRTVRLTSWTSRIMLVMKRRLLTVRKTSWKSEERRRSLWPKNGALRSPKALRIAGLRALQTNERGRWTPQWFQGGLHTPW